MKIGTLPLVPYYPPGDLDLVKVVREMSGKHHAVLLANHGPIVGGTSLQNAVSATEELEETARLFLMLKGQKTRFLTKNQVEDLNIKFPS
jgi:ribulose-5-phosphate 4-epimerase/fuculose-1-phosphate aldolase